MLCLSGFELYSRWVPLTFEQRGPGGLQCPCIYRIELDSSVREIARKEMQDAVNSAGLNGHAKIY